MIRNNWINKALFTIVILIMMACGNVKHTINDYSLLYLDDPNLVHPEYVVYHSSENESELHFRFKNSEVLYAKSLEDSIFISKLTLSYRLYSNYSQQTIADSGEVKLVDFIKSPGEYYLYGKMNIKAAQGNNYVLLLELHDDNRDLANRDLLSVNKSNQLSRENFLVSDKRGNPIFNNVIRPGEQYTITTRGDFEILQCRYYNREAPLPPPPFSVEQQKAQSYNADSSYWVSLTDHKLTFRTKKTGLYHLVADTSSREGLTLLNFGDDYPYIKSIDEMIKSVRFITSRNEYRNLENATEQKQAFERFWLSISSNPERAKLSIKAYYSRVQNANKYFTTHIPGWKTDRGLIYIVYGPPNVIYKNKESESWIYGEEDNMLSINFAFYKVKNPFSANDYVLSRSPILKNSWYRAVDTWRQGRIF